MSTQFEDNQAFIQWNEVMSQKYDSEAYHLRSNLLIRWIEQRRVEAVLSLLETTPIDTVLEVGCGAGIVLSKILAKQLIGLDLSGYILRKTTKQRMEHLNAHLLQANAESLPLANNTYDKILCTEVIEHVRTPRNVIKEMHRVATQQAIIVITIPNERLIAHAKAMIIKLGLGRWLLAGGGHTDAYDSPEQANEWHLHQFDLPLLQDTIANLLTIETTKAIPFRWLPFRYVVRCRVQTV